MDDMNTNQEINQKRDGFVGERMVVLPIETFEPYIQHPVVRRLYLTDIGYFPKAAHHYRSRPNGADQYIFFYCMEGSGVVELAGKVYHLQANDAFVIPLGEPHTYYADAENPWSLLWVHFKGTDAPYYPLQEKKIRHFRSEYAANRVFFLFDLIFRVLDTSYNLGTFLYITQALSLLLAEIYFFKGHESISSEDRNITAIIRYMNAHLQDSLTLPDLLAEFHCSKSYLNRLFQKHTEHAPMNFFHRLKMAEACKQLRSTNKRIYEIGQALGYKDPYYFSRLFKKIIGVSPQEYKEHDYYANLGEKKKT